MYKICDEEGNVLQQTDNPRFVKFSAERHCWIRCREAEAECIAINCIRHSIAGRNPVEDAPNVVSFYEVETAEELKKQTDDITLLSQAMSLMAAEIVERLENNGV